MSQSDPLVEIGATAMVGDEARDRTVSVSVQEGGVALRIRTDEAQKQHPTAVLSDDGVSRLIFALQRAQAQLRATR